MDMYRDHQSLKFDTHALPDLQQKKARLRNWMPLVYAAIFLGLWIYAMSLGGN